MARPLPPYSGWATKKNFLAASLSNFGCKHQEIVGVRYDLIYTIYTWPKKCKDKNLNYERKYLFEKIYRDIYTIQCILIVNFSLFFLLFVLFQQSFIDTFFYFILKKNLPLILNTFKEFNKNKQSIKFQEIFVAN